MPDLPDLPEIPEAFWERMQHLLGEEYEAFRSSYAARPREGLRVNTLKISVKSFRALSPFELSPLPWSTSAFELEPGTRAGRHPYHAAGLYYLQEPSATAVAELINPQPGERVLDLAAAPGGKATHLASLTENEGLLYANEVHPKRAWELAANMERWGARNTVITNETPARLASHFGPFFDRVLVDAPCSGEGMFRKSAIARAEWKPELIRPSARRQRSILDQAARLVQTGGLLAYATCTFAPEENEAVIAAFLKKHPEFTLKSISDRPGLSPGNPAWVPAEGRNDDLNRTARIWPHRAPGEGHFVGILKKQGERRHPPPVRPNSGQLPQWAADLYGSFCREHLNGVPTDGRLALVGTYVYALPDDTPDLRGLRVIHPGWWLGRVKKRRFEPSHALALGLHAPEAGDTVDFKPDDTRLAAYLRGEAIENTGRSRWVLITVDGFAVGWARRVHGLLKSRYPHGLRRPPT